MCSTLICEVGFAWDVLAARLTPREAQSQIQGWWHLDHQFSPVATLAWRWDLLT